ncbi:MAG: bile acid:sodium symporter family protein [Planctomyces sp.]|nr:bile acid:sodium symporter family protein [Planctomyces sp.]
MTLWLTLLSALAFWWPWGALDPFVAARPAVPWMIAVTMFLVGCLMRPREVDDLVRRWPVVLFGTGVQYTAMPLLGWLCATSLPLSPELRLGVIVAACVPDAMASGAVTVIARGNVSYSVSLTIGSTLLSPIVAPLAMRWAAGTTFPVDAGEVGMTLMLQVVGPVLAGHFICRRLGESSRLARWSSTSANLAILWIIAVVVGLNRARIGELFGSGVRGEAVPLIAALLGLNLLGYVAGYAAGAAGRLDEPKRRALSISVGLQNAGLGTALILTVFPDQPAAAIPTALYTFGSMWTGTLLAQWWSRRPVVAPEPVALESGAEG